MIMNMIEETYVSFETAKLAKEKGFDIPCVRYFKNKIITTECSMPMNSNAFKEEYSQPTQTILARWLREFHNMSVESNSIFYGYSYAVKRSDNGKIALPGGYQMQGETWQQAGAREIFEETGIKINPGGFCIHHLSENVFLLFRIEIQRPECGAEIIPVYFFLFSVQC